MNRFLLLTLSLLLALPCALAQQVPVTTASDEARVHYNRGVDAAMFVDFARARTHFEAAVAHDADFAMAHVYLAILPGSGDRAAHMQRATAAAANASEGERQMIASYAANLADDHDREGALLTAVAERYPDDPMPMFWWANTENQRGNLAAAVAAAERSLEADPAFASAYNLIGYAEMAAGNAAAAEEAFQAQIRLAPDEANPYDSYGEFLMNEGRLDEAEAQYEMALTKNSELANARAMLTRIAIMRVTDAFVAAINASDLDAYTDFYAANAVMMMPNGSELIGREAIREVASGLFASGPISIEFDTKENTPMGDGYVYQRGALTTEIGGVTEQGIATHIWAETADGWKIVRDMWTSVPAASGTN